MSELLDRFMEPDRRQTRVRRLRQDRPSQAPRTRAATIWHRHNAVEYSVIFDDGGIGPAIYSGHRQLEEGERVRATWAPEIHRYEIQALGQNLSPEPPTESVSGLGAADNHLEAGKQMFTSGTVIYAITQYVGGPTGDRGPSRWRSADGGNTWDRTRFYALATGCPISTWYERTVAEPNLDDVAHIAWLDADDDTVMYVQFDAAADSFGTEVTVDTLSAFSGSLQNTISITRAADGTLYIAGKTGVETFAYKSDDNGATWSSISSPMELANQDRHQLMPNLHSADPADIISIYRDDSASQITAKYYDASAGTWGGETLVIEQDRSSLHERVTAVLDAEGDIIVVAMPNHDVAGDSMKAARVSDTTITALGTPWTATGNDRTGVANHGLTVDPATGDVYVYVGVIEDGSNDHSIEWAVSTDRGVTWGAKQVLGETGFSNTSFPQLLFDPGGPDTYVILPLLDYSDMRTSPGAIVLSEVSPTSPVSHADLEGVSANDHHAQSHSHDGADGSGTVAHSSLTGTGADDHHAEDHASRHAGGGADELDGGALAFTPTTSGDWDSTPTTVQAALDELASRVRALEP